ncbi:MAG TPA: RHS repeat-associated core domain-containing protein, partial [Woeseiaceae bacterium]|nr:RHS repeat-associated core domain-containing protein [Woeseiaceae bacterium]
VYDVDAAGNVTTDGLHDFGYDDRGRLVSVDSGATATYAHNGQGQRVRKVSGSATTLFVYNEAGNLIGEYDASGSPLREHVWFDGAPLAVVVGEDVYYVHTDHLGTPRVISDGAEEIWRWVSTPFGINAANEDPDDNSVLFSYNLRFPGQYYDAETGLHYNYFRTYDPSTGRYLESDPIGLNGGLNTYGYALQNPIRWIDFFGLTVTCIYDSRTGRFTCVDDSTGQQTVDEICYSGAPSALNDPSQEAIPNVGPIPRGEYLIGTGVANRGTGPQSLPLTPAPGNTQFPSTRDPNSFLVHGDNAQQNRTASEGCIICSRQTRDTIDAAGGGTLDVRARPISTPSLSAPLDSPDRLPNGGTF